MSDKRHADPLPEPSEQLSLFDAGAEAEDDPEPEPGPNAFRNAHCVLVSDWDLWDASEIADG
ncbi:MAG TPA: hypothetical protein VGX94_01960 [Terriglobia bacterium]|nr:hypothetical protein [Terriglobia bacterium]